MDTLEWLLILGMAAILLIVYDGQRRERRARIRNIQGTVAAPPEPSTYPMPLSSSSFIEAAGKGLSQQDPSQQNPSFEKSVPSSLEESVHAGSFIGPSIHVVGHVDAAQPLTIAGRVEGKITLRDHGLTILASGEAGPTVMAQRVIVNGRLIGAVHTTGSATFHAAACFEGELKAGRLRCVEGATLSGQFSIG